MGDTLRVAVGPLLPEAGRGLERVGTSVCPGSCRATAVARNTPFEWGRLAGGELCLWREAYPSLLVLPHARFIETHHSNLRTAVSGMTASLVLHRFLFDCLHNGFDEQDVQPLFAALEPGELDAIRAAVKASRLI